MPEVAMKRRLICARDHHGAHSGAAAESGTGNQSLLPGIPTMNPTPMMMHEISATTNMTQ